jgi:hypothetical protein
MHHSPEEPLWVWGLPLPILLQIREQLEYNFSALVQRCQWLGIELIKDHHLFDSCYALYVGSSR